MDHLSVIARRIGQGSPGLAIAAAAAGIAAHAWNKALPEMLSGGLPHPSTGPDPS
jgi:hypothetical protein